MPSKIDIKKHGNEIHHAVREQTVSYLVAALSVVAGLAWNDAVKELIAMFFPEQANGLVAKFCYAVSITFVVVILTLVIKRTLEPKKAEEK